jgi:hypothetical protein
MGRRPTGVGAAALLVLAVPLLVGFASDPRNDVRPCPGARSASGDAPDLIRASAQTDEGGLGLVVTLTFDRPLPVPDMQGHPFRVDVLLNDPSVPTVSFDYYRDLNRILRFDATANAPVEIYLLPEHGRNVFYGVTVEGNTLTMRVPGRVITRDVDISGPALLKMHWGVIVRDGSRCDLLRTGRPVFKVVAGPGSSIAAVPPGSRVPPAPHSSAPWPLIVAIGVVGAITVLFGAWVLRKRRSVPPG